MGLIRSPRSATYHFTKIGAAVRYRRLSSLRCVQANFACPIGARLEYALDHCTNYNQILERHRYLDGQYLQKLQNSTVLLPSSERVSFRGAAYRTHQKTYEVVSLSLLLWAFAEEICWET